MSRASNWCFTLNNYTEDEYAQVCQALREECKYFIVGRERGAEGTNHLQGFASLSRCRNLRYVRDKLSSRAHFEVARGSAASNRTYCSKDGDFIEGGTIPQRGNKGKSRDELATEFSTALRAGNRGMAEFSDSNPGVFFFSGHNLLRNYQLLLRPERRDNIQVDWIYGPPGVGKSRTAHERMPEAYVKEPRTKWWNGYMQEKEVIIDDFGPNGIDINHLLRWFDRYKCMVETKGGMIPLNAVTFIVTSNFEPSDCWKDKDGVSHPQMDALYRRINIIQME
ncbi:replication-associated protein [Capybara virus 10_cap1_55]|uniref:Replication-associated protein n=1 Tax=Capybara virus 10_cap1_55 TaxID=2585037 RepID=A0A514TRW4_9VIRU|nr:replication-associated protein [Capybara virus 10_cap1_55]